LVQPGQPVADARALVQDRPAFALGRAATALPRGTPGKWPAWPKHLVYNTFFQYLRKFSSFIMPIYDTAAIVVASKGISGA
jgi:hypothetical protein